MPLKTNRVLEIIENFEVLELKSGRYAIDSSQRLLWRPNKKLCTNGMLALCHLVSRCQKICANAAKSYRDVPHAFAKSRGLRELVCGKVCVWFTEKNLSCVSEVVICAGISWQVVAPA